MSNVTFKMFVAKMGGTTATNYIGSDGEIFYDQANGALRISDGVTPGGNLLSSNSLTGTQVITALGFTPYNATNPSGYTTNTGTVTSVATSGTVSGLTLTGGTITGTGTITLGGTLSLTSTDVTTALGFTPVSAAIQVFSSNFVTVSTTTAYDLSTTASYNILNVTAGGLTATLNMPTSPANGQITIFAVIANTVTLAVGSGTVNPSFAGGHALGTSFTYTYRSADSTWYRVG